MWVMMMMTIMMTIMMMTTMTQMTTMSNPHPDHRPERNPTHMIDFQTENNKCRTVLVGGHGTVPGGGNTLFQSVRYSSASRIAAIRRWRMKPRSTRDRKPGRWKRSQPGSLTYESCPRLRSKACSMALEAGLMVL